MEETCHCGSPMHGSDHCPCCGCEAFERVCDWVCRVPGTVNVMDHSNICWEA